MIKWSKRVPREVISRLYNQSAAGICDDELADEAGYALFSRCESIVSVTNGFDSKRLICPICGADVPLSGGVFACSCGFHATWEEFRASYKNKQLYAANALPVFNAYLRDFPRAGTYGEKLICIDVLIHSFHIRNLRCENPEDENAVINRPAGANLIEGPLSEVILFLDGLSSIEGFSDGKEKWRRIAQRANGGEVLTRGDKPKDARESKSSGTIKWARRVKKAEIREV